MVNKKDTNLVQDDIEITNETAPIDTDPELEVVEEHTADIIKNLRTKLHEAEDKQRQYHEELQRAKADFLNAKRRLEEERSRDKERAIEAHVERLLPLCDSFHVAMSDTTAWEKADPIWRKGVEGIYAQLRSILQSYSINSVDPTGKVFDPATEEAISMVPADSEKEHNIIKSVAQLGYIRTVGDTVTVIRPARVIVAEYSS